MAALARSAAFYSSVAGLAHPLNCCPPSGSLIGQPLGSHPVLCPQFLRTFTRCVSLGASDEQSFRTALSVARNCAHIGQGSCRCLYETLV